MPWEEACRRVELFHASEKEGVEVVYMFFGLLLFVLGDFEFNRVASAVLTFGGFFVSLVSYVWVLQWIF